MKVKLNKSLIVFLIAIVALFFFMSSRSNADGDNGKPGGKCGWVDKKVVHCSKSVCTVQPKKDGEEGKCTDDKTKSWRRNIKNKPAK